MMNGNGIGSGINGIGNVFDHNNTNNYNSNNSLDRAIGRQQSPSPPSQQRQQPHQQVGSYNSLSNSNSNSNSNSPHLVSISRTGTPNQQLLPISRPSSSGSFRSSSNSNNSFLYQSGGGQQQQQQSTLDEAFRPSSNSYDNTNFNHNGINHHTDVQSLYHLPSQPFDSFDTLAGLKASPIVENGNGNGNDRGGSLARELSPGNAAREISKRTEEAFGRGGGGSLHPEKNREEVYLTHQQQNEQTKQTGMPLNQGGAGGLDPSIPSFEPVVVQPRKSSFAIPIMTPEEQEGGVGGVGGGLLSPLTSRNSSLSSEDTGPSMDPESGEDDAGMSLGVGGKEGKSVYRSPARKPLTPIDLEKASTLQGQQAQSVITPGTPPRQSTYTVPSIQTIAATPMKARYSPTSTGHHRRNDSFVGPTDSFDDSKSDVSASESPKRIGRLSLGGSSNSLRQLGRKTSMASMSSMATINEDKDKNDKRTLWFGDLEPWMDDNYIRSVCTMMGWEVDNIKLIRPSLSGGSPGVAPTMNAGYCFITFYTPDEALRVLTVITPSATNAPVPMPNSTRNFRANWASGATVANPFKAPTELPPTDGKEYSVFVGDLAPSVTEEILIQTFMEPPEMGDGSKIEGFAGVRGAKIMTDPVTGASKMYGFVRFSNEAEQQRALVEMQGVPCLARGMRISPATTRARTASGAVEPLPTNIARSVTPDYLLLGKAPSSSASSSPTPSHAVVQRAPSPVPSIAPLHRPTPVSAISAASAMADMVSPFSGTFQGLSNMASLTPGEIAILADPPLAANMAQIKLLAATASVPNPNGPPVHHSVSYNDPTNTTVFVGGLSPVITEDMLRAFFAPFGEISKVTVPLGKKCGFVHYGSKVDAERSIEKLQGFPLGGSQLRLSWGKSSTAPKQQHQQQQQQQQHNTMTMQQALSVPPMAPSMQVNPLQAQIQQMQQQLAALTAMANQQTAASNMTNGFSGLQSVPALSPASTTSYSTISPLSAGGDPFASLAMNDPQYFSQLLATNPSAFTGALGNGMQRSSYSAPVPSMNETLMAQLQANQQQMLQLQALQAQLEDTPKLGAFSPFSPNPAAEAALQTKNTSQDQGQFWQGQNPHDLPTPKRSVSPFSQAAQAMAERASERNSGRSRHSTSPGENLAYLSAQGSADRRQSSAARYNPPGHGSMGDFFNQARSRTKSESVQQAFAGMNLGSNNAVNGGSWMNGTNRAASFSDMPRDSSESPQSARRSGGGGYGGQ